MNKEALDWDTVLPPDQSFFDDYTKFAQPSIPEIKEFLDKVVILKLNGGLGIRMGLKGPKSAIEVYPGITFLDLTVMHVEVFFPTHYFYWIFGLILSTAHEH